MPGQEGVRRRLEADRGSCGGGAAGLLLPTDGPWRGAMHGFQDPALLTQLDAGFEGHPFLSIAPLTAAYLGWTALWVAMVWGLAAAFFGRKDL